MLFDKDNRLKQRDFWLLGVVTFLGVLHRLFLARGILPYVRHPDEVVNMNVVLQMLGTRTLNPHFFNYPSLWFYLQAVKPVEARSTPSNATNPRKDVIIGKTLVHSGLSNRPKLPLDLV